jgi:WD40 repeat protein
MSHVNHIVSALALAAAFASSKAPITAIAVTPDGNGFVFGSHAGIVVRTWDGKPDQSIATESDNVHSLAFSADGSTLAVAGGSPAEFGFVELWSWPDRKRIGELEGHDDVVHDVAWLGDGKTIVTASADRSVRVWESASGKQITKLAGHSGPVLCLAISADGKMLCSGSVDQTIRVWDTATWQLVRAMTNHLGPVHALSFRPRDKSDDTAAPETLASAGGDGTVRIWRPGIGRMVRIVRHPGPVHCLAWDSDGRLFSGSKDGHVREIDADDGSITREVPLSSGWLLSIAVLRSGPNAAQRIIAGDSLGAVHVSGR